MAKVTFGAFVTDIKGKVGSTVFQSNKAGAFVRNKVVPANPQTANQILVRGNLSTLSAQWRGLTDEQRNAWVAAAPNFPYQDRLGQTKTYSGQQLFMKLNTQLLAVNASQTLLTTPPTPVELPSGTANYGDIENTVTAITVTVDADIAGYVQADHWLELSFTGGLSPGVMRPALSLFKQVQVANPADLSSVIAAGTAYAARLGVTAAGLKVFGQLRIISKATGQAALIARWSGIVADGS